MDQLIRYDAFARVLDFVPAGLLRLYLSGDRHVQRAIIENTKKWHMHDCRRGALGLLPRLVFNMRNLRSLCINVPAMELYTTTTAKENYSMLHELQTIVPQLEVLDLVLHINPRYNHLIMSRHINNVPSPIPIWMDLVKLATACTNRMRTLAIELTDPCSFFLHHDVSTRDFRGFLTRSRANSRH